MTTGVIVAGGRSTRFGSADKVVANLVGKPLVRWVGDRLLETVDDIVVNCRDEQVEQIAAAFDTFDHEITYALDPQPDQGPLAGIRTGLRVTETEYAAVVAGDMPFIQPALIDFLFERAEGHDAAVPRLQDGLYQPMQAVYRTEAMADAADRTLGRGEHRIVPLFEDLDVAIVSEAEVNRQASLMTFENLNTPREFAAATARFTQE
jgi:molybdopterin-guanine dinucleotide biosynthesis protein A